MLYAAFVSSLHKIIGIEFGTTSRRHDQLTHLNSGFSSAAYFVQNVVSSYERYHAALQEQSTDGSPQGDTETRGKECSNLVVLISELYNFQVISCLLVFDIIRGLLDKKLSELSVELLLKVVRSMWFNPQHC